MAAVFTLKGLTQVVDGADGSVHFRRVAPALDAVYVESIQSDQAGPKPMVCDLGDGLVGGWGIPYRAIFHGLS